MFNNGKCPCCGYEYEYGWNEETGGLRVLKGDRPFVNIEIENKKFTADIGEKDIYGLSVDTELRIYGCPKCSCVHFREV